MVKTSQILKELQAKLEALETKNAALEARILELEHPPKPVAAPLPAPASAAQAAPVQPQAESISEEVMLAIAAAVAAYLGERAHIRVVRLVPSQAWAQQGRVSIQASHRLA
jgi:methylmalonyl-CoA carboxyltransferase large subunit